MLNAFPASQTISLVAALFSGLAYLCSTPFGITDHFTVSGSNRSRQYRGAQRLSASQTISRPQARYAGRRSQSAQRLSASQTISRYRATAGPVRDRMCSTPFGITDHFHCAYTSTPERLVMCSTPFGITDHFTRSIPDAPRYPTTLSMCSTPFGITDHFTLAGVVLLARWAIRCAQRLSASQTISHWARRWRTVRADS